MIGGNDRRGERSLFLKVSGLGWECPAEIREILAWKQMVYILLLAEEEQN